jgi:hypothetical protein
LMMETLRSLNTLVSVCQIKERFNPESSNHPTLRMPNVTKPCFCLQFYRLLLFQFTLLTLYSFYYYYYMVQFLSSIFTTYIWQILFFTVPKICSFSLQLMQYTVPIYSFYYLQVLKFTSAAVYSVYRLKFLLSTGTAQVFRSDSPLTRSRRILVVEGRAPACWQVWGECSTGVVKRKLFLTSLCCIVLAV